MRLSHLRSRSRPDSAGPLRFVPECLAQYPSQTSNSVCGATIPASTPLSFPDSAQLTHSLLRRKLRQSKLEGRGSHPGTVNPTRTLWRNVHCQGCLYFLPARLRTALARFGYAQRATEVVSLHYLYLAMPAWRSNYSLGTLSILDRLLQMKPLQGMLGSTQNHIATMLWHSSWVSLIFHGSLHSSLSAARPSVHCA